jgi:hypothetical protein
VAPFLPAILRCLAEISGIKNVRKQPRQLRIAERAGVSIGTLYQHFPAKRQLVALVTALAGPPR